jgi:DNA-binding MarR family transcriptional regulator
MTGHHSLGDTEKAVEAKLGGLPLQWARMQAAANIHRAAAAVRLHFENSVLRGPDLTWTAFVVLWVVWIWGSMETRFVAKEAGITKGTLTGVVKTLEARGLAVRTKHAEDGRLVLLSLSDKGEHLMQTLFPAFNEEEAFVTAGLSTSESDKLASLLRKVVSQVEQHGEQRRADLRGDS